MKAPEVVQLTRDLTKFSNLRGYYVSVGPNCLYQFFQAETTLEALIPGVLWHTRIGSTPCHGIPIRAVPYQ